MLKGKILREGRGYLVKVGSVTVDVTEEVRELIASVITAEHATLADLQKKHADTLERYNKIQSIVLAGGAGMPTG